MPFGRTACLVAVVALASCGAPRAPHGARQHGTGTLAVDESPLLDTKESSALAADVERAARAYRELLVATAPESASALGLHERDDALDPKTREGEEAALAREEAMLADLRTRFSPASRAKLRVTDRVDLAIVESALAVDVRSRRHVRPLERQPDVYLTALDAIYAMTSRSYADAPSRARCVLARLEKLPAVLEGARGILDVSAATPPPRVYTEVGIERATAARTFIEAQRAFLEGALPAEQTRVRAALDGAARATDAYAAFLRKVVLPRSSGDFAVGREHFAFLLREEHQLDADPQALEALGQAAVERTRAELREVARRVDPSAKDWPEVVRRHKERHPAAENLLATYRTEVARARDFLVAKGVIELPVDDDLVVTDTPAFLRSTVTAAYDQAPPFDAGTRGFFFVTPIDPALPAATREAMLREHDHGDIVDTAVHEAYPGHHLQLSTARRHPSLARRLAHGSTFSEGWALYSEELMAELGYYTDEERLMQLVWTLVRAVRVVLDVGLHTKGMTFDAAVRVLVDEVHLERPLAVSEVKRYTLTPTQPLSYLVGRERIRAIRARFLADRGDASGALAAFHREVLAHGTIPPGFVEAEMFDQERASAASAR